MPQWPPNLETLIIRSSLRLRTLDPLLLPTSLSIFRGTFGHLLAGNFPTTLTSLTLELGKCSSWFVFVLPVNLKSLSIALFDMDHEFADDSWCELPSSLEALEASLPYSRMDAFISRLPPHLGSLALDSNYTLKEANVRSLPRHLRQLKAALPSVINASFAELLPRTLTDLNNVTPQSRVSVDAVCLLPSNLTSVRMN